jgi:hypothetical protein
MKIGLYNLEPRYTNLALEKVRCFYGDKAEDCSPLESRQYDLIYCSSIFDWTSKQYVTPDMLTGGTGFDLTTKLPPEIDAIIPRINRGFTTRGCIRKCKFCVVPEKEGYIHAVSDLLSLWDGEAKSITLYDNNILALPEHFAFICQQARENNIKLDFNQGLDHRLLTPEIVDLLLSTRHHEYRFAFDHPSYITSVDKAIDLLQSKGINRCSWYVLVGFDTTFQQDLDRLNHLRERNQLAFVQRYRKNGIMKDIKYTALARWANQHHIYRGMTWNRFLSHPENRNYKSIVPNGEGE